MTFTLRLFYVLVGLVFLAIISAILYLSVFFNEVKYEDSMSLSIDSFVVSRGAGYINGEFVISDGGNKQNESFLAYITTGDSIIKKPYSDTIRVHRAGSVEYFILDSMKGHPKDDKSL